MRTLLTGLGRKGISILCAWAFLALASSLYAQQPEPRISTEINTSERTAIRGSHSPKARPENEAGRVLASTRLEGMTLVFRRSAAQEADLQQLIAGQQDPASFLYQKWLSPDEFAARFGVSDADIAATTEWLEQQGFTVESVALSKNQIRFSGSVQQAEQAFGMEMHYYKVDGETHFSPSADINIPIALSGVVQTVRNLSSFRPHSHLRVKGAQPAVQYQFTSGQTKNHFLTPEDIATIYDINAAYNAGYTGGGQSIAVLGQSSVVLSDIENFQKAAGFNVKDPTLVLVPNSGTATVVSGDEAESDLDLEYSSTIAKGASIVFVYTGNGKNYSVWDSLQYAVDHKTAPVLSISYGVCETELSSANYASLTAILAQGAAQGQSIVAASGDGGSTDCSGDTALTTAQQQALAVDFPAASQYVTGIGGTMFPTADVDSGNTKYWTSSSGTDVISSALSYISEQVWNDDSSTDGVSAGGGGASAMTARPTWQTGVPGIPSGSNRLVPDISLDASPNNAGFLYCSSDATTTVTGSCTPGNGFRDSNNSLLTVAGGTSFGAPIFAGMLAIINQKLGSSGQGVVNPILYKMAANAGTYSSAFHDITTGTNACTAGTTYCSTAGAASFSATTGFDEATGLGSVDFNNLLAAWPSSASLIASKTALSAATTTLPSGASDTITIVVSANSGTGPTTPTGTVSLAADGTIVNASLPLLGGSATYNFSSTTAGAHTITANYSGDSVYSSSSGSVTVTVGAASKGFALVASNVTVAAGSTGTSTITITPQNGYTGTIKWAVSSNASTANVCFSLANAAVSGTTTVTASLTVKTTASACGLSAMLGVNRDQRSVGVDTVKLSLGDRSLAVLKAVQTSIFGIGLILIGLRRIRAGRLSPAGWTLVLLSAVLLNAGCSSTSSSSASPGASATAAKGSYTVTITGTDTMSSAITASTSMTLTID